MSHFSIIIVTETVPPLINVGSGFDGEVRWDTSKPDGTLRKLMDSSKLQALGWQPALTLKEGIRKAYEDFLAGTPIERRTIPLQL